MGNTYSLINYDFCLNKLFIYCLLIACKVETLIKKKSKISAVKKEHA